MVNDDNQSGVDGTAGNDSPATVNSGSGVGRRTFLKAAGAGGVTVTLAGCTFNPDDATATSTPTEGDGDGTGATATPTEPGLDVDAISIGVLAPAPQNDPIGASIAGGAQLAAQQLNAEGGIAGAEVDVTVEDTAEDPATGRDRYQELTVGQGVDLTLGVFTSEVLLNIMDDIASQETVHLTTGAATPEASALVNEDYEQYKYHFRTGPINAHHLGENLVAFADEKLDELGWESVAVLVEDYEWTNPVSAVLNDQLGDTGLDIVMNERYASGTENFSPIYDDIEDSGADAAYIAMAHTGTPAVLQWAQEQRPFEFGGIHVPMQLPQYYDAVSGACRFGVTQNTATPQSAVTEQTIPFAEAFQEAFDTYPVYTGYISYDAVMQYASVVESQVSIGAEDVIAGLEESSYTGTAGTIEYYPPDNEFAHDVVYDRELVWPIYQQWQTDEEGNGVQEVIYPDELATAEYQAPPWV